MNREPQEEITLGLRMTLLLTATVMIVLGSALICLPGIVGSLYGTPASTSGMTAGRIAGAAIFALGALAWQSKRQAPAIVRSVSVPVLFTWFVLKTIVTYFAVLDAFCNPFVGRTILLFDALLAVIYAYHLFRSS